VFRLTSSEKRALALLVVAIGLIIVGMAFY